MKPLNRLVYLIILIVFLLMPHHMLASNSKENWTIGPWETQQMFAWGSDLLVVDLVLMAWGSMMDHGLNSPIWTPWESLL